MTSGANYLYSTAEVLEKTAAYLESLETNRMSVEKTQRAKVATDLAARLSAAVGEPVSQEVAEKVAQAPEIHALLNRLAGGGDVESLGGPQESNTKTAAVSAGGSDADRRWLEWCVGQ